MAHAGVGAFGKEQTCLIVQVQMIINSDCNADAGDSLVHKVWELESPGSKVRERSPRQIGHPLASNTAEGCLKCNILLNVAMTCCGHLDSKTQGLEERPVKTRGKDTTGRDGTRNVWPARPDLIGGLLIPDFPTPKRTPLTLQCGYGWGGILPWQEAVHGKREAYEGEAYQHGARSWAWDAGCRFSAWGSRCYRHLIEVRKSALLRRELTGTGGGLGEACRLEEGRGGGDGTAFVLRSEDDASRIASYLFSYARAKDGREAKCGIGASDKNSGEVVLERGPDRFDEGA
ncbi:hypothetical protein DFH06DRAFT_1142583 [Mycena polygramma]|nr:hypothetical protein DFH06DRAFT_1142583 [Mycena polygramma]